MRARTQVQRKLKNRPSPTSVKKTHPGRTKLPDNLPVEEVIIEPEEDTTGMVEIGEEVTETLDYKPGKLLKRRYIRKKYARLEESKECKTSSSVSFPNGPFPRASPSRDY